MPPRALPLGKLIESAILCHAYPHSRTGLLISKREAEARSGRQDRFAEYLCRKGFVVLDELGYLPFAQSGGQLGGNREAVFFKPTPGWSFASSDFCNRI